MSCDYAEGLSPYDNKGKLGLKELFDTGDVVKTKVDLLSEWILTSKHTVVHTGAGISTAAGIPDFRGPKGVWTLEAQGKKPEMSISFDDAVPTKTHMALKELLENGKIQYIVSQNIDGLHLKSGVPRKYLAELHGNMFVEECGFCKRQLIRKGATSSVGKKCLGNSCPFRRKDGRVCRGKMHDVVLDWEHGLPEKDLEMSDYHSSIADLSICLGTTLQIVPSGDLPLRTKKTNNGRLVIVNLQPTKHDKKADLIINTYVDDVITRLMDIFQMEARSYSAELDPTKTPGVLEWTIKNSDVGPVKRRYLEVVSRKKKSKKAGEDSGAAKKRKLKDEVDSPKEIEKEHACKAEVKQEPEESPLPLEACRVGVKREPGVFQACVKKEPRGSADGEGSRGNATEELGSQDSVTEEANTNPEKPMEPESSPSDVNKPMKNNECILVS